MQWSRSLCVQGSYDSARLVRVRFAIEAGLTSRMWTSLAIVTARFTGLLLSRTPGNELLRSLTGSLCRQEALRRTQSGQTAKRREAAYRVRRAAKWQYQVACAM